MHVYYTQCIEKGYLSHGEISQCEQFLTNDIQPQWMICYEEVTLCKLIEGLE